MTEAPRVLPFLPVFHAKVRHGEKTHTARMKSYGRPGDMLQGPGCDLELLSVTPMPLGLIARDFYAREGLGSPEEFREVWRSIHPRQKWSAWRVVQLHEFRALNLRAACCAVCSEVPA